MTEFLDFIALALAANSVQTAWLYGSLFDSLRGYFDARKKTFFGELMTCPLCLPYHVAFWTAVILWLPAQLLSDPWDTYPRLVLYSLAVTTIIHFLQGVLPLEETNEEEKDDEQTSNTINPAAAGNQHD